MASLGAAVVQDVARLPAEKRRIDRHGDRAGREDRQIGHQPLGPALGDDRDAIAGRQRRARPARATRSRIRSNTSLLESAVDGTASGESSRPTAAATVGVGRARMTQVERQDRRWS